MEKYINKYQNEYLLPCFVKPKYDELFSSWLVRLAYAHSCKSHNFYKLICPDIHIWNRDIDKLAPEKLIKILSNKTPYNCETIEKTTLKSYDGSLFLKHNAYGNQKWILPLGIFHRKRNRYGLVFCPKCLKKDKTEPYFRKHWRLSFSTICTTCGVFMQDKCPQCKMPVIFFRNDLGNKNKLSETPISYCYNCSFNLAYSKIRKAPKISLREQQKLFQILQYGFNKHNFYPHQYFNVLRQLLKVLLADEGPNKKLRYELSKKLKTQNIPNIYIIKRSDFELLPIKYRYALIRQAIWLLNNFPIRLIAILKKHNFKSTTLLKDFNDAPFWYYEVIMQNFFISNVNRRF